jgi:predicted amidohydrolase
VRLVLVQPQLGHSSSQNLDVIRGLIALLTPPLGTDDVLVLPERFYVDGDHDGYVTAITELARSFGCHVVGGSHSEPVGSDFLNTGIVAAPDGGVLGRYEKLRPYAAERAWAHPGLTLGEVSIAGRNTLILICADFWFADVFQRARVLPDLVLVPALSVTRKPTPDYSRSLWRHLAVARAYEFGCFVGVSDWGHPSQLPVQFASGVAGFADPTLIDPERLFQPVGEAAIRAFPLDFDALDAFRRDRIDRGFFWKMPEQLP